MLSITSGKKTKPKLIVVVGPTASGKSDLAIVLARKYNGEIISADSRQVYRGLDIGTGKVPGKWVYQNNPTNKQPPVSWINEKRKIFIYKDVPHHCIDFVPPQKIFTAADFKKCASAAITDIIARDKIPIITGGTGFYIDTVISDFNFPDVKPNAKLRSALTKKSTEALYMLLKEVDRRRAGTIDHKNRRRLIRAIEVVKALGRVPKLKTRERYETLWLGIKMDKNVLRDRIHKRLILRMRHGMLNEAKRLRKNRMPWSRFYQLGLEYRFMAEFLRNKINKVETVNKLEKAIIDYARRQTIWFKRNKKINWVRTQTKAIRLADNFIDR